MAPTLHPSNSVVSRAPRLPIRHGLAPRIVVVCIGAVVLAGLPMAIGWPAGLCGMACVQAVLSGVWSDADAFPSNGAAPAANAGPAGLASPGASLQDDADGDGLDRSEERRVGEESGT